MRLHRKAKTKAGEIDYNNLPRHIAIIMDGNGRWAKRRAMPRTYGHSAGAENFRRIATYCRDIGIKYLTVYAFSTENWKRPKEEIDTIMGLLEKYLFEAIETMGRDKIKLTFSGDTSVLTPKLRRLIVRTHEISNSFEGFQVNVCLNYGGRDEILRAAETLSAKGKQFTEENFSKALYSAGVPDPDLIIRPGGEMRISNFLIWQSAYSELYFSNVLWPDFTKDNLNKAISDYQSRNRRYGGIEGA